MKSITRRLWQSSTAMMALNNAARVAALVGVTPLVLRKFVPADTAAFYLFSSAIGFQWILVSGLISTFVRYTSYLYVEKKDGALRELFSSDLTADTLLATMRVVFGVMSLIAVIVVGCIGTWLAMPTILATTNSTDAWLAWGVILVVTGLSVFCAYQNAYLQGAGWIVLEQRTGALISLGSALTAIAVLIMGGGLLSLVISNQTWVAINCGRICFMTRRCLGRPESGGRISRPLLRSVWAPGWRSVVGALTSSGMIYLSNFLYARLVESAVLASYLVGLRLMQIIGDFSRSPFYSKIPEYNRLRAEGNIAELRWLAGRQMDFSFGAFLLPMGALAVLGAPLFEFFGSQVPFLAPGSWLLLGAAYLLERYCNMHLQLYSTTNHIIWHTVNGITGAVLLVALFAFQPMFGIDTLALGMLTAYACFFMWYVPQLACRSVGTSVWKFDAHRVAWVSVGYLALLFFSRYAAGSLL